jgi:HK97 family phage portal protein
MKFLQQIGKALKQPVFSGYGGRGGWGMRSGLFSNGSFDYRREAGPLWESCIPFMCLRWEQRATIEAELVIQRRDENGDWKNDPDHSAMELISNPNPFFDIHQLLDAVRFDYHLSGNGYIHIVRSKSRKVRQLWWIPSWMIEPRWEENGLEFINCYEYMVDGVSYALPVEDIIHFKNGIDPRTFGRKGLGDFSATLREVCTDNERAVFTASLLRNMGIPGVIISPKGGSAGDEASLTKRQRAEIKEIWSEFTGEGRGEPWVQSIPVEVNMPGFSPQQLLIDKISSIPEQRLCGSFGIPASVLQLGTGLENSNTKANKGDDREQAYESCVIPTLQVFARTLTRVLMSELDDIRKVRFWFDLSEVRCLAEDENAISKMLTEACGGPYMTVNEARGRRGLKPIPGGDDVRAGKAKSGAEDGTEKPDADPAENSTNEEKEAA